MPGFQTLSIWEDPPSSDEDEPPQDSSRAMRETGNIPLSNRPCKIAETLAIQLRQRPPPPRQSPEEAQLRMYFPDITWSNQPFYLPNDWYH